VYHKNCPWSDCSNYNEVYKYGNASEVYIENYEDCNFNHHHYGNNEEWWIVLRDAFNTFSSRLRCTQREYFWWEDWKFDNTNLWKLYAKEFIKTKTKNKIIFINYNEWFENKNYRINLASRMKGSFTDKNLEEVPQNGNGSSFDLTKYNNKAQKMKVMNRWRHFSEDFNYWKLFDQETIDLSNHIFGKTIKKTFI